MFYKNLVNLKIFGNINVGVKISYIFKAIKVQYQNLD